MYEVLHHYMPKILASDVLSRLNLEKEKYFVVSAHREENVDNEKNFSGLLTALNQIAEKYNYPIIFSTHPRTRKRLERIGTQSNTVYATESHSEKTLSNSVPNTVQHRVTKIHPLVQFLKPLGFSDYNALQINSYAVLSDSGTISEESSIMNFRALNIREAHERPEAMEEATVMMVGLNPERIMQGLVQLQYQAIDSRTEQAASPITNHQSSLTTFRLVADYSMPNVSEKVVRIILGYTDYVKRVVWRE